MSLLRDPLLLTLLASGLVHGALFSYAPAPRTTPIATVRAGRTAVRLNSSFPAPPPVTLDAPPEIVRRQPLTRSRPDDVPRMPPAPPPRRNPTEERPTRPPDAAPPIPLALEVSVLPLQPRTNSGHDTPRPPAPAPRQTAQTDISVSTRPRSLTRLQRHADARTSISPPRESTPPSGPPPSTQRARSTLTSEDLLSQLAPQPRPSKPRPTSRTPAPARPPAINRPADDASQGAPPTLPTPLQNNPAPGYPADAASERRQGTVIVVLQITAQGIVSSARVHRSSGHADLDASAVATARKWRFRPAMRNGRPAAITVLKPFRFLLQRR